MSNNKSTGYLDDFGKPIFVGDKLLSKWGFQVVVIEEDNTYSGKLVCDDNHPCKNIPYALNKGNGYTVVSDDNK